MRSRQVRGCSTKYGNPLVELEWGVGVARADTKVKCVVYATDRAMRTQGCCVLVPSTLVVFGQRFREIEIARAYGSMDLLFDKHIFILMNVM